MQGYVAFLDVLGFSALVNADESGERLKKFSECLRQATEPVEVDYVVFSDSIVLTAKGDDEHSFFALTEACSHLLAQLLDQNIAIRGAIAFGPFLRSQMAESVFVGGRAVIDAYNFEQEQDWVGVMIAPSARARLNDLAARCRIDYHSGESGPLAPYLQPWAIPFHSLQPDAETFSGFAVVPTIGSSPEQMLVAINNAKRSLAWLREIAPTPGAQRKYQRAIKFLEPVQFLWQELAEYRRNKLNG